MRVKVRRVIDTDAPINMRDLTPVQKVTAGALIQIKESYFYKKFTKSKHEAEYLKELQELDNVKSLILALLYRELVQNVTLKELPCDEIIISVEHSLKKPLEKLMPSIFGLPGEMDRDFIPYEISRVAEDRDLRLAYNDMPILLRCKVKTE